MALACTTPISTMIGQEVVEAANQIPSNQHLQRNLGELNQQIGYFENIIKNVKLMTNYILLKF